MSARKLIYRFMVLAPALFLAGIGVNARSISTEFDTVRNDSRSDAQIFAYVPYMRECQAPLRHDSESDLRLAMRTAKDWIAGAQEGKLKPLLPSAYEDTSSEGVKSQVFDAKSTLEGRIISGIQDKVEAGKFEEATRCTVTALELGEILKYSDFISLYNCASEQRRALLAIQPCVDRLSPDQRERIRIAVRRVQTNSDQVDRMVRRSRNLFLAWRVRNHYQPLPIEDTRMLAEIPAIIKGEGAASMTQLRDRMFVTTDRSVPSYFSSVRLGVCASNWLDGDREELLATLDRPKS
jgi:hypothetical protein